jgi:DNA-binding transcriptional regulator YiaG
MTGEELKRRRQRLKLTQTELARLIGVHKNTVARWERGELGMKATTDKLINLLTRRVR